MPNENPVKAPAASEPATPPGQRVVDERFLRSARLPFVICIASIIIMASGIVTQVILGKSLTFATANSGDSQWVRFLTDHIFLMTFAAIAIVSAYAGYRLVVAAGATATVVIPQQDYELLAPLVAAGKADAIDQYVRLSSLAKFTGKFTQLGLTGLPLATIGLTVFFSVLTFANETAFLDLAKLTLGAFIGSFVQRQVERRAEAEPEDNGATLKEIPTPATAR